MVPVVRDVTEREQTAETLKREKEEVERINRFMIDREERIISLKREVNELCQRIGQQPKYQM